MEPADASTGSSAAPPPAETGERFPCRQCGAILAYEPGTEVLRCQYCGFENPIEPSTGVVSENCFRTTLVELDERAPMEEVTTVKCDACAAEITRPPSITSLVCPYCNSNIVAQPTCHTIIRPGGLLPFRVTRTEGTAHFRKWITSRWFAPNKVRQQSIIDEALSGIYVPYWTYDAETVTKYTGKKGVYYYVTVGTGNNRRTERRTRWYPAWGTVRNSFDDILILASRSLPRKHTEQLEPWDLHAVVEYRNEFLSGFRAETYQIDLRQGFGEAQKKMEPVIRETVRRDIGGDTQIITSMDVEYHDVTFKHLLLPVWISAYRYNNKVYRFLVNGRTGEVQGERPYSWVKISFAVLLGLIALAVIAYFVALK